MRPFEIRRVISPDGDVAALVGELEAELSSLYAPEQRHGLALHDLFEPHIRFFLAFNNCAVGCGGVALFPGFTEVKRMYVRPEARGTGVADSIMDMLVQETRVAGLKSLRLETGIHQLAAISFYRRVGFRPCSIFPPYASMPEEVTSTSVFMERSV